LNREIRQAMAQPDVQEKLAALGYEPVTTTPEEFAARIAADIPKWSKVIRDADIKLEQ
jgi:tripartite-type tricarboxylate transporter receptor subunit TctC